VPGVDAQGGARSRTAARRHRPMTSRAVITQHCRRHPPLPQLPGREVLRAGPGIQAVPARTGEKPAGRRSSRRHPCLCGVSAMPPCLPTADPPARQAAAGPRTRTTAGVSARTSVSWPYPPCRALSRGVSLHVCARCRWQLGDRAGVHQLTVHPALFSGCSRRCRGNVGDSRRSGVRKPRRSHMAKLSVPGAGSGWVPGRPGRRAPPGPRGPPRGAGRAAGASGPARGPPRHTG
jgi:hypothetical protein